MILALQILAAWIVLSLPLAVLIGKAIKFGGAA
jgi:hypothetical protein